MFIQFWAALWCPVCAGFSGYLLTGKTNGVFAGVLAYTVLVLSSQAARLDGRTDYWASKLAMLKAEEAELHRALAQLTPPPVSADDTSALTEAYRTRLALLQVQKKALRAGYLSPKSAGVLGHFSETKGGLLPDAG
jgi:hypothetical protein